VSCLKSYDLLITDLNEQDNISKKDLRNSVGEKTVQTVLKKTFLNQWINEESFVEWELAKISRRILDILNSMPFVLESGFYLERAELITIFESDLKFTTTF